MKNGFLLIRAKFLQKILLIKKLYVPVSMKINQSIFIDKQSGKDFQSKRKIASTFSKPSDMR